MEDGYKSRWSGKFEDVLQRDWSASISQTREEQFLDSEGPPPLEVPRKVTAIFIWFIVVES